MKANSFHSTDTIQNKEAGDAATQNTNAASFEFRSAKKMSFLNEVK